MLIRLNEIPTEGKTWTFSRKTTELNESLRTLIRQQDYVAEITIVPLEASSGAYEIRGSISTQLSEECSRCGIDFDHQVNEKFQNMLMPSLVTPRDGKFVKPNNFSDLQDDETEVAEYEGNQFNVGEFFHEIVALAEPTIPAPPPDKKGNCSLCQISLKDRSFSYDSGSIEPAHPFAHLKGIKLN